MGQHAGLPEATDHVGGHVAGADGAAGRDDHDIAGVQGLTGAPFQFGSHVGRDAEIAHFGASLTGENGQRGCVDVTDLSGGRCGVGWNDLVARGEHSDYRRYRRLDLRDAQGG